MLKDFKEFILRGNVVDLAVGVVIGAAFGAVVTAFVADFITPLIAIPGSTDFADLDFTIRESVFRYGHFLNALISFLLIAISVFFILPVVSSLVFTTVSSLEDLAPWLDLQTAQSPLVNGDFSLTGEQLGQSAVTALIWVLLPLVAGWYRTLRAEVK